MGIWNKLFGKPQSERNEHSVPNNQPEHAVIVSFEYGIEGLSALYELEDKLRKAIRETGVGEYDGHEIAANYSDGILYMYGPNAERLYQAIQPVLKESNFMKGAIAQLRFGPPGYSAKEIEVEV